MGASKIENAWNSSVKHKLTTGEILPGFSRFAVACRGGVVVLPSQLLCFLFDISFATFVPRPQAQAADKNIFAGVERLFEGAEP